jgi:hypothetical protein
MKWPMRGRQPATSHGARLHARASAPAANSFAPALDAEQADADELPSSCFAFPRSCFRFAASLPLPRERRSAALDEKRLNVVGVGVRELGDQVRGHKPAHHTEEIANAALAA